MGKTGINIGINFRPSLAGEEGFALPHDVTEPKRVFRRGLHLTCLCRNYDRRNNRLARPSGNNSRPLIPLPKFEADFSGTPKRIL